MQRIFELLVFDWDGTLMDSEAHIVTSMQRAAADVGLPVLSQEEVKNIIGLSMRAAIETLFPGESDSRYQDLIERYRLHFFTDDPCEPFAGAESVLESLHGQGYLMAVATGKGRHGLDRVLKHTGFERFFATTRCADESHSKPHPQMLLEIMAELDIPSHKTLMIGDTEYDLQMAHAAGAAAVGVDYGVHERQRLLDCNPMTCLTTIEALPDWLTGLKQNSGAA